MAYWFLKGFSLVLSMLPVKCSIWLVSSLLKCFSFFVPRFRKVAYTNLEIAFPDREDQWKEQIIEESIESLARLVVDICRIRFIDREWIGRHVDVTEMEVIREARRKANGEGVLCVTGHLGSFELLAHCIALEDQPISFIFRNAKQEGVNRWIRETRESNGNSVIPRKGAYKALLRGLRQNKFVAVLFDQNIKRQNAVFVDWFGLSAATTRAVALSAIKTNCSVILIAIQHSGDDQYKVRVLDADVDHIRKNSEIGLQEKVQQITQVLVEQFCGLVKESPGEWFWLHRRWKTRPDENDPRVYIE